MEKHITLVAALHIAFSILGLFLAAIFFIAVVGGGLLSGDDDAITITAIVGGMVLLFIFILSIPGIIGGIGLLKRATWSRILMLVIAFLELINIPFGTILGVYTIWVLVDEKTVEFFEKNSEKQS